MKKVLLILALIITASKISAQTKFEPQLKLTYDAGITDDKNNSFGAEFLAGIRMSGKLRLGVGVGISYCDLLYEDGGVNMILNKYYGDYRESSAYIPIFANIKYNFTSNGVSPYVSADLGYSAFISCSDYANDNKLGLFCKPCFGIDFPIKKGKIFLEVGYKYQHRSWSGLNSPDYMQATGAIGYQF